MKSIYYFLFIIFVTILIYSCSVDYSFDLKPTTYFTGTYGAFAIVSDANTGFPIEIDVRVWLMPEHTYDVFDPQPVISIIQPDSTGKFILNKIVYTRTRNYTFSETTIDSTVTFDVDGYKWTEVTEPFIFHLDSTNYLTYEVKLKPSDT